MTSILVIGMVDSIHTAHWIERIVDKDLSIEIMPSRNYRRIHPLLVDIINENRNVIFKNKFLTFKLSPYIDYAKNLMFGFIGKNRSSILEKMLQKKEYDYIHALEIQHAGYMLLGVELEAHKNATLILTNWGSDIYYFAQFPEHEVRIRKLLAKIDRYSAECSRDYELASQLGFHGKFMKVVPNSYSFSEPLGSVHRASERNQIICKTYGGEFGLGLLIIESARKVLELNSTIEFFFYSVTKDLESKIEDLISSYPRRVRYSTVRNPLSHNALLGEFSNSRIYVGASRSDGISTSFLEAMSQGSYPIQTNTSCASDWIAKGCVGSVVGTTQNEILNAILQALYDDERVNLAQAENLRILQTETRFQDLSAVAKTFYR